MRPAAAMPAPRVRRVVARADLVVYSGAAAYALVFMGIAAVSFIAFDVARLDLGDMVQAVWSTAHGDFLGNTTLAGRHVSRLGGHVDPFLALLVPFWWAWPSGLMLLIVQAAAVSAGALPVYWLAREHLASDRAAAHFAFAYLLYPATQFNAFTPGTGFHSVSIAVPLLLFAIWFLDRERLVAFAVCAVLAASTKEEIGAAVGCLGIWFAVRHRRVLVGAVIAVAGFAASAVDFFYVIPHYALTGVSPFAGRYADVGGTPSGIAHRAVTDPLSLVHAVATGHKLAFVLLVLGPFVGLWLLEPLLALCAAPELAIDLLSSRPEQTTINFHYTAGIVPFVVAASVLGAARLRRNPDRVSMAALAGVACVMLYSPIVASLPNVHRAFGDARAAKAAALKSVPPGSAVSASNQLAAYVSARRDIYLFPHVGDARIVVVDRGDRTYSDRARYRRAVASLVASARWRVVSDSHGVVVLRKLTR